ncbi:hypothetical protein SAMN05660860_00060 [Geoalkalibacter ferrihydriticus]|uniref:Uncharacterized protein n=2 Tax=Geoalkalibacter ferrihydriticus TaxID=392333 RepID=A0A0C2HU09_9BACT|nr:hypothetical protein [Geoalkalibacter ferrihydriticus]KIH76307.1 hypothetical protein GFER_11920 [Geoalkalibacter ferrihydriticus DSM 17813]SDL21657.1 hypothetical protein SAMN05660860_00060 [Geoalkalibacter ferrihydriticus]
MKKNITKVLAFAAVLAFSLVATTQAAVPPPPANQFVGFPDTVFANVSEADCRACHGATPPEGVPVDTTYLPDRHHLLIGTAIPPNSVVPHPEFGTSYMCFSCHGLTMTGTDPGNEFEFDEFRNCSTCHTDASPHHLTSAAQIGDCRICHGAVVDNGLLPENREVRNGVEVPVWLPTYNPSLITPWPSRKNGDSASAGNCTFCHAPSPQQATGLNRGFAIDPMSGVMVYNNADTHHLPGFMGDNADAKCSWCHPGGSPFPINAMSIRTCQNCHGIPSLHNIQYDNTGDGIMPGQMDPWYGHIGNNLDCMGCHASSAFGASAADIGNTVPQINSMTSYVIIEGTEVDVELSGFGFISRTFAGNEYVATVVLTDKSGTTYELAPKSVSPTSIEVTVPAYLPAATYRVVAQKADKVSRPEILVIKPLVAIDSADIQNNGDIVIAGQGFGIEPPQNVRNLGVEVAGAKAQVLSWNEDRIVVSAANAQAGQTVEVLSTFAVSTQLTGEAAPPVVEEPPVVEPPADKNRGRSKADEKSNSSRRGR